MSTDNVNAARRVRDRLRPAEDSLDTTLGQLGHLLSTVCTVRVEGGFPAHLSADAIGHLTGATARLGEVRAQILSAHDCFARDLRTMLPATSFGDWNCPKQAELEEAPSSPITAPLRAVK